MWNWIAIDRHHCLTRAESCKLFRDAALHNTQRINHLVFEQIPLRVARVAFLFGSPETSLFADSRHIQTETWRLKYFFNIAQAV